MGWIISKGIRVPKKRLFFKFYFILSVLSRLPPRCFLQIESVTSHCPDFPVCFSESVIHTYLLSVSNGAEHARFWFGYILHSVCKTTVAHGWKPDLVCSRYRRDDIKGRINNLFSITQTIRRWWYQLDRPQRRRSGHYIWRRPWYVLFVSVLSFSVISLSLKHKILLLLSILVI